MALFATTLNFSLNWLKTRSLIAIILGAISGPLAYWGGSKLGALKIIEPSGAMIYLSLGWAIVVPALLKIASSIDLYTDFMREGEVNCLSASITYSHYYHF